MGRSPDAQARTASQTRGMSQIHVNGVTLYYEEHGAGAPILGIHGAGSSAAFWSEAAAKLAKHGRTIVYDRRGCSRSERPEPYTTNVHEQADDAAALIEALDAVPAVVIGRSYGGAVALDLALRYPDLVRALVQLEGDAGLSLSETAMRELAEVQEKIFAAAQADIGSVAETVVRAVAGDAPWEGLPDEAKQILAANGAATVAELSGGYPEVTVEQLASVDKPTLLVGARDSVFDYSELMQIAVDAMPAARVEWVEGGHLIDPAHQIVLAFVGEVLGRKEEPCTV